MTYVPQLTEIVTPELRNRFPDVKVLSGEEVQTQRGITAERLCKLPLFNTVALKMLSLSAESQSALQETETLFKADPALAAELLLLANSAEFGLRARVGSIRHALTILGLERVRDLVMTIAMHTYVRQGPRSANMHPVWAHSFATAVIAGEIAAVERQADPLFYTAGLMHDVGRLGLLLTSPQKYSRLFSAPFLDVHEANSVERLVLGFNHCEAGGLLSQTWGLPDFVQTCARHHHGTDNQEHHHILSSVRTACQMAESLGFHEFLVAESNDPIKHGDAIPERYRNHPLLAPDRLMDLVSKKMATVWK